MSAKSLIGIGLIAALMAFIPGISMARTPYQKYLKSCEQYYCAQDSLQNCEHLCGGWVPQVMNIISLNTNEFKSCMARVGPNLPGIIAQTMTTQCLETFNEDMAQLPAWVNY
jgi:hypothetical protein